MIDVNVIGEIDRRLRLASSTRNVYTISGANDRDNFCALNDSKPEERNVATRYDIAFNLNLSSKKIHRENEILLK